MNFRSMLPLLLISAPLYAAPSISIPTINTSAGVTNQTFDVLISNPTAAPGAGQPITDYTFSFNIKPEPGATGTVTLTGDWAVIPPNPLLPTNPGQGFSSNTYFVSDFVNADPVPLDDGKALFRAVYSVSANASGVFDLVPFTNNTQTGLDTRFHYSVGSVDNYVGVNLSNGYIIVSTPEPTALLLLPLTAVSLIPPRRRKR